MGKFSKIFGIVVSIMFFVLGGYILFSPRFDTLSREIRVVFAVVLYLYGAYRLFRYIYKDRDRDEY
jgi:hypothetical protein